MSPERSTEDLIRHLAARPVPGPFPGRLAVGGMAAAVIVALGLFWMVFGLRLDLVSAWSHLPVQAKTLLPLSLSGLAVWLALASSRPGRRLALWPLAIPVLLGVALVVRRLEQGPAATLLADTVGSTAFACLASITFMSALPLAAGIWALRRAAPTRPALTGALLGLAAGAGVAAGYALHCTEDSPLFFMSWYGLAIALVTSLGAVLGSRFLRW